MFVEAAIFILTYLPAFSSRLSRSFFMPIKFLNPNPNKIL